MSSKLIAQTISTVAGSSLKGDGRLATGANLNNPAGTAIDGAGNLYIADQSNHKIRKVSTSGIITTVAGIGVYGFSGDGFAATSANLASPQGIALDGSGNLYIADSENHRVRKVSASGIISTVAGDGNASFSGDGGAATAASLKKPTGVAVDGSGNLYIADSENHRIRKVAGGIITTIVGSGTASFSGDGGLSTTATLNKPVSVTVDGSGNLYIADLENHRIRKVVISTGIITTVAGNGTADFSGDGGVATAASLHNPRGVTVDGVGNLYIADQSNHRIRMVSGGIISTVAGNGTPNFTGDGGAATAATLYSPAGLILDAGGNLYIADQSNYRIRKVSAGTISTIAGNGTESYGGDGGAATSASIFSPFGVVVDGGNNLYIADQRNHRIRKVSAGIITTVAGNGTYGFFGDDGPATSANLANPAGLALDGAGNLYLADQSNHRIRKVSTSGTITTVAGDGNATFGGDGGLATTASLNLPASVAVDGAGNLYIADAMNNRIRKVSTSGIITTVVGTGSAGFSGDGGVATAADIFYPSSIAIDGAGNLYFADQGNNRIRKVSTSGIITTVVGNGTQGFGGDGGLATAANLNNAGGIALDEIGNLYIVDQDNNRIRIVSTSGIITTLAGTGSPGFSGDGGPASAATIANPIHVAVDINRNVYITDADNNRVRKVLGPPIVRISSSNPTAVCSASTFSLTATPANFTPSSYSWVSQPTGLTATGATPTFAAPTVNTPTVYTLTVTATNGMASPTASVTLTINPTPAASLNITATPSLTVTGGQSNTLTASGATTYVWSTSATSSSIVITKAGVYSVTGTSLGCSAQKSITIYGNIASVQDGNWSSASTWNCSCVPTIYDTVTLSVGHHVTVSQTVRAKFLKQFGTLLFNSGGQILF
ncbi:hypothetical protein GCM10028805_58610 [Spirosoma harenae]